MGRGRGAELAGVRTSGHRAYLGEQWPREGCGDALGLVRANIPPALFILDTPPASKLIGSAGWFCSLALQVMRL